MVFPLKINHCYIAVTVQLFSCCSSTWLLPSTDITVQISDRPLINWLLVGHARESLSDFPECSDCFLLYSRLTIIHNFYGIWLYQWAYDINSTTQECAYFHLREGNVDAKIPHDCKQRNIFLYQGNNYLCHGNPDKKHYFCGPCATARESSLECPCHKKNQKRRPSSTSERRPLWPIIEGNTLEEYLK